jgi:predicted AlkP superfamily pyrophosphatase or phosphodiesterase
MSSELLPAEVSFARKAQLFLEEASNPAARLVVGYFPLIDDFNHAYFDLFETEWPGGRVAELFTACARLVDDFLSSLMAGMSDDTLLVVSSDHGAMAQRSMLHLNEVFADAGLTRRAANGFDERRSTLWYHPSDCGQVIARDPGPRASTIAALRRVIDKVNRELSADIGIEEGTASAPYLAFLYPRRDMYFTARPGRGNGRLVKGKTGGHHLSPLSPTPWIEAVLGLWSRRPGSRMAAGRSIPSENTAVKRYILESMEIA